MTCLAWNNRATMGLLGFGQADVGARKRFRLILREQGSVRDMGGEGQSQTVGIVDNIFVNALDQDASDIHLQPERDRLRIRYRMDGVLHDGGELPPDVAINVISRIKLASGMRIDENREPQDGRVDMEFMSRHLSARASCVPCLNGEKMVLRILDPQRMKVDLTKLGMSPDILKKWQRAIEAPYGLILVTGPTGSGKTSTLYASLNTFDAKKRNVVTVEDPIEYEYDKNIAQVQVTEKMTFPRVMRSFLRQDPDVMMVGEMRDPESLAIGIQAGLTGHLVLSTIHTNNAVETISRMVDMDAEPYLIAAVTVAILAQRLVRLNCPKCAKPYKPTDDEINMLSLTPEEIGRGRFMKGEGCADCRGTGYKGRIGVFEIVTGSPEFRSAIANMTHGGDLMSAAREQNYASMLDDGRLKAMAGWTTPEEVIRAVHTQAMDSKQPKEAQALPRPDDSVA